MQANVRGPVIAGGGSAGSLNFVTDDFDTIGGGRGNLAGNAAAVQDNAQYASVGGGYLNTASGYSSIVGGGSFNDASDQDSTVGGGFQNNASSYGSTVGGGSQNIASGSFSTVGGGGRNIASGDDGSTGGGGSSNTASGERSTVPGGDDNRAAGAYSFAAGRGAKALADGSFVWADSQDNDFTAATPQHVPGACRRRRVFRGQQHRLWVEGLQRQRSWDWCDCPGRQQHRA